MKQTEREEILRNAILKALESRRQATADGRNDDALYAAGVAAGLNEAIQLLRPHLQVVR